MAVNLGTRGVQEAVDLLEYCNHPRRHEPVRPAPRATARRSRTGSRLWCLGNEMDGPWQIGHKTAARVRPRSRPRPPGPCGWSTPTIELVACGSSNSQDAHLRRAGRRPSSSRRYEQVDYISAAHLLRASTTATSASFLACGVGHGPRSSTAVVATADHVGARLRSPQAAQASRSTSGTSGTSHRFHGDGLSWTGPTHRPLIEDDLQRRRRGGRRQPADHPAAPRRPGRHRLPGPAGQRDRPDPDRARRAGLAADDLPPVRPDRAATPGASVLRVEPRVAGVRDARQHGDVPRCWTPPRRYDEESGDGDRLRGQPRTDATSMLERRPARPARPAGGECHDPGRPRRGHPCHQHRGTSRTRVRPRANSRARGGVRCA